MLKDVKCTVSGLDELDKMLGTLAPRAVRNALRSAAKKGAAIWEEAISQRAPKRTGFLSENIKIGSNVDDSENDDATAAVTVEVGPSKQAYYGQFLEFGTKHAKAQPFMRPAFEEKTQEVLETFKTELGNALARLKK